MRPALDTAAIIVLVVEDEPDLREAIVSFLGLDGFAAYGVGLLQKAEQWLQTHTPDIVVLDLCLPDGDGLEWLQRTPSLNGKGVIITTARGELPQRIAGIKAGADAYLVKPIQLEELASMVANLSKRVSHPEEACWRLHALQWLLESPQGGQLKLTHSEMVVLRGAAAEPGRAVHRDDLIVALGLDPATYDARRMEVLVRRLRTKAKACFGQELPLETAHRFGYAFTAPIRLIE